VTGFRTAIFQPLTLPWRLGRFLAGGPGLADIPAQMRQALETREDRFLRIMETRVYARARSPYRRLLEHAGCEFVDVQDLTRRHGLEGALRHLAESGVYLNAAELKGKEDVVRGDLRFRVDPRDLQNVASGFASQSSGTNNPPQQGTSSFDWMAQQATTAGAFILAHGLEEHRHSAFEPMLPGVAGMMFMFMLARLGIPTERWFARAVPFRNRLEGAYFSLLAHEVAAIGTYAGPGFASPERVTEQDLGVIVQWIRDSHRKGRRTCVRTAASNAARIATWALERGQSLQGVTFLASGEPLTAGKLRPIDESGADVNSCYGFEPGSVWAAVGCANPAYRDEMHLSLNTLAVVNPLPFPMGDRVVHPLLYTTLHDSAGRLLLNAESGDYAELDDRDCGCLMHELGLTLHVHRVRSYEKLTAGGMSYPADELIEVLELRLPAAFGGGPSDYQLVEEEGERGQTHLTLRIHPRLGELDEARILTHFIAEVGKAGENQRFVAESWRGRGTFRVARLAPRTSARGKMMPVLLTLGRTD